MLPACSDVKVGVDVRNTDVGISNVGLIGADNPPAASGNQHIHALNQARWCRGSRMLRRKDASQSHSAEDYDTGARWSC